MAIKAIQTSYKGYRFRSRLEARWAVFLDALNIKWQYEPEGFATESGWYLPDFLLPEINGGFWLEIKPEHEATNKEKVKLADEKLGGAIAGSEAKQGMVVYGEPMTSVDIGASNGGHPMFDLWWMQCEYTDVHNQTCRGGDGPYLFCVCNTCGKAGIQFDGRGDRVCGGAHAKGHGDKGYSYDDHRVVNAAYAARSARFEFGESGAAA